MQTSILLMAMFAVVCVASLGVLANAQGTVVTSGTSLVVDSTVSLLAQVTLFLGALGGILAVLIPRLNGKAREYAEAVASFVDQTDRQAVKVEAWVKENKARIEALETVGLNLANVSEEDRKKLDSAKKVIADKMKEIEEELERDTVQLDAGRLALSELLKK